jgi:hypothetical protein
MGMTAKITVILDVMLCGLVDVSKEGMTLKTEAVLPDYTALCLSRQ